MSYDLIDIINRKQEFRSKIKRLDKKRIKKSLLKFDK